jgi:hypothetical protein
MRFYSTCSSSYIESQTYDCSGSKFSAVKGRCESELPNNIGTCGSFVNQTSIISVTLTTGYNFITSLGFIYLKSGWMIGLTTTTATIALDTSGVALVSDIFCASCSPLNSSAMARVLVTRPVVGSFMNYYPTPMISFSMSAVGLTPLSFTSSRTIAIYTTIFNVTVIMVNIECLTSGSCSFLVGQTNGTSIQYTWIISGSSYNTTVSTNSSLENFTFPSNGQYTVSVIASNPVSNATSNTLSLFIQYPLSGLSFFSANPFNRSQSASATHANASFLLMLTGTNYNCSISYGN